MPQATRTLSVSTATAVAASALVALGSVGVANAAAHPTINEFSNDVEGANDPEFVEFHAAPGTSLAAHTLLVVRGATQRDAGLDGSVYRSIPITGTTDANGLLSVDLAANTILNSSMTLMLVTGPAPTAGADLDANDDGVLDESLAFTIVDSVGTTAANGLGRAYGDTILSPTFDGGTTSVGGASRRVDGADTGSASDWVRNAYSGYGLPGRDDAAISAGRAVNTPGLPNVVLDDDAPSALACATDGATRISAVQGPGDTSPIVGSTVQVEGVITAVHPRLTPTQGLATFAVQEESGDLDADPATSEGIVVEGATAAVSALAAGQQVRVEGVVSEQYGRTHIDMTESVVCADSVALPAATELTIPFTTDLEATEGMLVTFPQDLTILETFGFGRYGELALGPERQYQPTSLHAPGSAEARALSAENLANRITLDDAVSAQNPDPARHPNGESFTLENRFRAGDLVTNVTGVLDYGFGSWRIQPTAPAEHAVVNERPDAPEVGGDLQVAAFNVLNYFTTLGDRGAQTADELQRQQDKIVASLLAMDADIVGLVEIENGGDALSALVAALNAAAGEERYAPVGTGRLGTDAISTALIYQPEAVTPRGAFATLDETIDPRFDTAYNRPALTQSFLVHRFDEVLTVSVNHLKSKGSSCAANGDPLDPNGQGECNGTRATAATALAEWLSTDPTGSGSTHSMIIGDLNSYASEDPIVALEDAGYVDLLETFDGPEAYTYTFDGMLGSLDHAIASPSLATQVVDATAWHANTDEVSLIDYSMGFKLPAQAAVYAPDPYRASDHDAVLVGIAFDAQVALATTDPASPSLAGTGGGTEPGAERASNALPTTGGEAAAWPIGLALALVAAGVLASVRHARHASAAAAS